MKQLLFIFVSIVTLTLIYSCGGSTTEKTTQTVTPKAVATRTLDSIDVNYLKELYVQTDAIDLMFNDLPISMSMDTKEAAQKFFTYFQTTPATLRTSCASQGQVLLKGQGEILAEFNFYFQEGCTAFVLVKDRKEVAGNQISGTGAKFFQQIMSGVSTK